MKKLCTCLGICRGKETLGEDWQCALTACPNQSCRDGVVDTGGVNPDESPIMDKCNWPGHAIPPRTFFVNPAYLQSVETELEMRVDWIKRMCAILGYDNSDGFHSTPDPFELAQEAVDLAKIGRRWHQNSSLEEWFPFTAEELERYKQDGCAAKVGKWIQASKYRTVCHRHNGVFVAADEAENKMMRADTLPLLADALMNWPKDAEPLPPSRFVKVMPWRDLLKAEQRR